MQPPPPSDPDRPRPARRWWLWALGAILLLYVLGQPETESPVPAPTPVPLSTPGAMPPPSAEQRGVVFRVRGTARAVNVTYMIGGSMSQVATGLPWEHRVDVPPGTALSINAQNQGEAGGLAVFISRDGLLLETAETNAPYGIAQAATWE